jgi:monoterpene epsilon-lactone hydrolase
LPLPSHIVLFSPFVDISMINPEIAAVRSSDHMLNEDRICIGSVEWLRGSSSPAATTDDELRHPGISPLYGDLSIFRLAGTKLVITTGWYDILHPDIELFVKKAGAADVQTTYIEAQHLWHYLILFTGVIPEADQGQDMVVTVVNANSSIAL